MEEKNYTYNNDFSITCEEFLSRLEALEKNRQLQRSLLNKNNIITFPKHVSIQTLETRL